MYGNESDSSDEEIDNFNEFGGGEKKATPQATNVTSKKRVKRASKFVNASTNISFGSTKICGQSSLPMVVEPSKLQFEFVQPGILYVMTISIRNISQTAQRIRMRAPKSGYFALNYIPSGVVSPGLDIRAQVECQVPEGSPELQYLDSIVVSMGENSVEIPIIATKKIAQIEFESLLDFGFIAKGQKVSRNVMFSNSGAVPGSLKFNSSAYLSFLPPRVILNPGEKQSVNIILEGVDVGVFREVVDVIVDGALAKSLLDVNAHCVPQALSLLKANAGGIIEEIEFGSLFYGETKSVKALVVNSGPQQLSFSVTCSDDDIRMPSRGKTPSTDEDTGGTGKKMLNFTPGEGVIKPFSQIPVVISLSPEIPVPATGFRQEYLSSLKESLSLSKRAVLECIETGQRMQVGVSASVSLADISVTPSVIKFGSCSVNDRRDVLIELGNNSVGAVPFSFSSHAQFRIVPAEGVLDPHQSRSVIATFHPGQLGIFNGTIKLSISHGLQVLHLKLSGEANDPGAPKKLVGGLNTCTEDFQEKYKFVNPATVEGEIRDRQERALKKKLDKTRALLGYGTVPTFGAVRGEGLSISTGSLTREAVYGQVEDVTSTGVPGDNHPLTIKRQHNAIYNTYLQAHHLHRTETKRKAQQGGNDRSDPFGVDMGMERSLDEPVLKIPEADNELWLASKGSRLGGDGKRLPFDENRLIQRKYGDTPSTQAELRDCTAELSPEELKLVHAAQKVLNFGRVNIGSVVAKNFAIINDMSHAVCAVIEDLELELKQSRPEKQIIPAGAMAGFDILFNSRVLGEYKKAFTWTLNGLHNFKVLVRAEVVPVELVLNRSFVVMEFAANSLESSLSQEVTLTNPGNAPAEYLWGSAGAFAVKPEQGIIYPGKSAVATITWTPAPGKRNEEELGLHINTGVDQILRVQGLIKESRLYFEDKTLNFNTISTGVDHIITTYVKNAGANSAVFCFDPSDERLGINVSPRRAVVEAGESLAITVTLHPLEAQRYDRVKVSASVRGSKSISFRLEGEAIVPQLSLLEESFNFGVVALGSEWRLPFTIVNSSLIAGSLLLNLDSFPEFRPCFRPLADEDSTTVGVAGGNSANILVDVVGNQIAQLPADNTSVKHKNNNAWCLTVAAGATMQAALVFVPTTVRLHEWQLPLQRQGMKREAEFCRPVIAEAVASRLNVSNRFVDFGDRVVDRDPVARASYFLEISFTNPDVTQGLTYEIRERDADTSTAASSSNAKGKTVGMAPSISPAFFISPLRGSLGAGSWCPIRVTFQPGDAATYTKVVDVYLEGQPVADRPYMSIVCKGTGAFPRLSFDRPIVQLPTVPLGITSRASFTVRNHGYGTLELRYRLSPTISLPLDVSFPDGTEVGVSVSTVQVVVAARAESPTSWSGKLEFYDNDGERFSILLCGCTDNSLFTNYSFVRAFSGGFSYLGLDEHPVRYLPKDVVEKLREKETQRKEALRKQRLLERQQMDKEKTVEDKSSDKDKHTKQSKRVSLADVSSDFREGVEIGSESTNLIGQYCFSKTECSFLLKWLNAFVCKRHFDVNRFPECVIESGGELVAECLELLSGSKVPGFRAAAAESVDPQRAGDVSAPPTANPHTPHTGQKHSGLKNAGQGQATRATQALKALEKCRTLLAFVMRSGGLLNHIDPAALLGRDDYILVQESELREREGSRFTASILRENAVGWERRWQNDSAYCWFELLLQAVKVFSLARVTFKELQKLPGMTVKREEAASKTVNSSGVADRATEGGADKKKVKKERIPSEFTGSNVYSTSELVLLSWASHHLQRSLNLRDEGVPESSVQPLVGLKHRVVDLEAEFGDLYGFCQVLHSHIPEFAKSGGVLCGYSHQRASPAQALSKREEYFQRLREALRDLHFGLDASREEMSTTGRMHFLMLLQLFFMLPQLTSKTTIDFTGLVGVPIVKTIELRNPSKRAVKYQISLRGSTLFSVSETDLILPPESLLDVPVTLVSNFLAPAQAQITFWGVREAGSAGATMVFQLQANLTGRSPVETLNKSLSLFEWETFHIVIRNPFSTAGVFPVSLRCFHRSLSVEDAVRGLQGRPIKRKDKDGEFLEIALPASERKDDDTEYEAMFRMPFWCDETQLQLGPGAQQSITVHACPFQMGAFCCQLVFADPQVGEFCYEIKLEVGLNRAAERVEFQAVQTKKGQVRKAMRISSRNPAFERAVSMLTDHRLSNPNKKLRARSILQGCVASLQTNEDIGDVSFYVEFVSPFFSCGRQVNFISEYLIGPDAREKQLAAGLPRTAQSNRFPKIVRSCVEDLGPTDSERTANTAILTFTPDRVGTYQGRAVVWGASNPLDIRVIDIQANVSVPPTKMLIEFHGPAKQSISQDIPIRNDQEKDLNLTVTVTGRGFSAPKTLQVPKGATVDLRVQFISPVSGSCDGVLTLRNTEAGPADSFSYTLLGVASDPVAEGNLTFICKSRCKDRFLVPLRLKKPIAQGVSDKKPKEEAKDAASSKVSESKDAKDDEAATEQVLIVCTDLPYLTGPSEVRLINGEGMYEFNVLCPVSGLLSGSISFNDSTGKLVQWYTVDIEVTSPKEESTIQVVATVRTAVAIELVLENPTPQPLQFTVILEGDGLIGENLHTVAPKTTSSSPSSTYELLYSPLVAGDFVGKIRFFNSIVGEFWYRLEMRAEPAPAIPVAIIECMVGCTKTVAVPIENPLGVPVQLALTLSDAEHFSVPQMSQLLLQPYAQTTFDVVFRPSSLSDIVSCELIVTQAEYGTVTYRLSGKGLMPGIMAPTNVFCPLTEIGSYTVPFRNPFAFPLPLDFVLSDEDVLSPPQPLSRRKAGASETSTEPFAFGLLLRKSTDVVLQPKAAFPIGLSFSPRRLGQYTANIQARATIGGLSLLWIFPIVGMAESAALQRLPRLSAPCKTSVLRDVDVPLEGLGKVDVEDMNNGLLVAEDFSVEVIAEAKHQNLVNRSFRAQFVALQESDSEHNGLIAKYRLLFEPLRTFTTTLELIVSCRARGRWRLQVELESLDPEPDDVISLTAPVGGQERVSFRLANRFLGLANFEAYFTAKSSPHFAVSPATGVLAQYGSEGTPFVVTFAPLEYGVIEIGHLVISTEDAQWNYKIVGHYPSAAIKQSAIRSKIDTGLHRSTSAANPNFSGSTSL